MLLLSTIVTLATVSSTVFAGAFAGRDICGTHKSPEEIAAAEARFAENRIQSFSGEATIKVHWHVINSGDTHYQGNVPDSHISAQMSVLNHDFAGTGLDFELVSVTRTTNSSWFDLVFYDNVYDREAKSALRVGGVADLNVYSTGFDGGKSTLGYATFPDEYADNPTSDGVVILYSSLPGGTTINYNGGQTLTHEVGHWIGLYHTFEGGCSSPGDYVDDTPPEENPAHGCPVGQDTCGDGIPDPIHNYMDYGIDSCMTEWTPGQIARAMNQLATYRGL